MVASLCEGQSFTRMCPAQTNSYDSWSWEDQLRRQTWILGIVVSWGETKSFRPLGSFQNVQGIVPHTIQPLLHSQHFCQHTRTHRQDFEELVSTWSETVLFFGLTDGMGYISGSLTQLKWIPSRSASSIWRKRGWATSRTDGPPSPLASLVLERLRNRCGCTW